MEFPNRRRVVVFVEGGVVTGVATDEECEVMVIDYDDLEATGTSEEDKQALADTATAGMQMRY